MPEPALTDIPTISAPNADQVAYWNGDAGAKWTSLRSGSTGFSPA